MAALGYSGISVDEGKTDIFFGNIRVAKRGVSTGKDREAAAVLRDREIRITIDLHLGKAA